MVVQADRFCGLDQESTRHIFGLDNYMRRYGGGPDQPPDLTAHPEEFDDWRLTVPFQSGNIDILCCPEDRVCDDVACMRGCSCCTSCKLPVCRECEHAMSGDHPSMPASALANDMMIFYAPRELYTMDVNIPEMICASVCITSMICFTLEAKYRSQDPAHDGENPFDSRVHMSRHRMGARGNATTFPLPWQELLAELQTADARTADAVAPDLPWVGEQLAEYVSIILKTNEEDDPKSMASFVHQAVVRRSVVVKLIQDAKDRGHRSYRGVCMARVREKSESLPVHGVPSEIVKLLPHDEELDKILVQKAATPVGGRSDLPRAAELLSQSRPNAVVLEKSSYDDADINAQRITALHHFANKLDRHIPLPSTSSVGSLQGASDTTSRKPQVIRLPAPSLSTDETVHLVDAIQGATHNKPTMPLPVVGEAVGLQDPKTILLNSPMLRGLQRHKARATPVGPDPPPMPGRSCHTKAGSEPPSASFQSGRPHSAGCY